jgi:hypothetical protein
MSTDMDLVAGQTETAVDEAEHERGKRPVATGHRPEGAARAQVEVPEGFAPHGMTRRLLTTTRRSRPEAVGRFGRSMARPAYPPATCAAWPRSSSCLAIRASRRGLTTQS